MKSYWCTNNSSIHNSIPLPAGAANCTPPIDFIDFCIPYAVCFDCAIPEGLSVAVSDIIEISLTAPIDRGNTLFLIFPWFFGGGNSDSVGDWKCCLSSLGPSHSERSVWWLSTFGEKNTDRFCCRDKSSLCLDIVAEDCAIVRRLHTSYHRVHTSSNCRLQSLPKVKAVTRLMERGDSEYMKLKKLFEKIFKKFQIYSEFKMLFIPQGQFTMTTQ